MTAAAVTPDFPAWRAEARRLLQLGLPPEEVDWPEAEQERSLFGESQVQEENRPPPAQNLNVPAAFLRLAEQVMRHTDPQRRSLLYRMLWRLTRGGEPWLLHAATDPDVHRAALLAKSVHRDIHRMHAFVRFRGTGADEVSGREQFVAWYEPEYDIVRAAAPFFEKRFAGMDWSILTPRECVHWNGERLHFTAGVSRRAAPSGDELDALWRTYYRSIFNPARLKVQAMQTSMPVKYWKNLPEAETISGLISASQPRTDAMLETPERTPRAVPDNAYIQSLHRRAEEEQPLESVLITPETEALSLPDLKRQAAHCRACPLWEKATQTVFGEGPEDAPLMIVGEQPGDREDLSGRPFTGPAGQLLREALREAGVEMEHAYVTNAVKHFKWEPRGKRRLHVKPDQAEVHACRPWILQELRRVQPRVLLLLGATAVESLLPGTNLKITRDRGPVEAPHLAPRVILTFHPSYLLRLPDGPEQRERYAQFVQDLSTARSALTPD